MERFLWIIVCLLLIVWGLTSGVHYGTTILLSLVSLGCAGYLTYKGFKVRIHPGETGSVDSSKKILSPFHGFGCIGWMLILMIVLCFLSMIPIPMPLLGIISPKAADWYREAWELEGVTRNWGFITTSLGRTAFGLWNLIGAFGVYVIALRLCATRGAIHRLSHLFLMVGAGLLALLFIKYLGFSIALGESGETSAWHIGLPINANHQGALFCLFSLMSLGGFLTKRHRDSTARKSLWFLCYVVFGIAVVITASRGAIVSWVLGQILLLVFFFGVSRKIQWKYGLAALCATGIVIAAVLFISSSKLMDIRDEFAETEISFVTDEVQDNDVTVASKPISKTQMYGDFVHLIEDWGRAGIGRSAFRDVYPQYQSFPFRKHFRHAENEYWEILMEYGLIWGLICLILGCAGFACFCKTFWNAKDERPMMLGFFSAIIAIAIQNFFDFGMRYYCVGLPFWMFCGALEARRLRWKYGRIDHDHSELDKKRKIEWIAGNCAVSIGILAAVVALPVAVDGQTQMSLHRLAICVTRQGVAGCADAIDDNMIRRAGSHELRRYIAQKLVHEGVMQNSERQQKTWETARKWYTSASQKAPHDAWTSMHLGKCCLALGDETCAASLFNRTAQDDSRKITAAMHEMSALQLANIELPSNAAALKSLIQALMARKRYQDAIDLLEPVQTSNPGQYIGLMCLVYQKMDFEEGCDALLETVPPNVLTPEIFTLRVDAMLRARQYPQLFIYLENSESALGNSYDYWQKRLYTSVFYGKEMGDAWYRDYIPRVFLKVKQKMNQTAKVRFDLMLCEAKYALELGQFARARGFSERALAMRPNHPTAQKILDAAILGK